MGDPQEAYEAFSAFLLAAPEDAETVTITDDSARQRLVLRLGPGVISRIDEADPARSAHLKVDRPHRLLTSTMLFFENGYAGLDHFGQWFADLADLDAAPETRGAARAAAITTEAAAIDEVGRIWADSGHVDPSDRYYVFFGSHGVDDDRADRAELLQLIEFLGLERVDAPAGAAGGEVWVRSDPRLDAESARWS
ncbi:hypothetical protein [Micromonospora auratinigra]|uniref:hypothetical protein n=1 Tax=Micromonospora auratinigra TaxID=261654 RepID=UPI001E61716D|nr:hypothetical protein [Micromonospora auratinigra]